jgi:hypothetical protein
MSSSLVVSLYANIIFLSGWYCIRKTECSVCSCCFRYSADKHVSFSPLLHWDIFSGLANFRKFEICLATCTSCFDVFQVESSFFTQLNFFCLQCLWRWCHDIGREQAANKPLLKTVFQVSFASNLLTASSYLESQNLFLNWLHAFRLWWDCLVHAKQHCYLSYVIKQGCVSKKLFILFFLIILICCWCD